MALVLTRREGESIQIGDEIVVTVAWIRGNRVRLTTEAPKALRISRLGGENCDAALLEKQPEEAGPEVRKAQR